MTFYLEMFESDSDMYECEECSGIFIIKPDTDEKIEYCPQCGTNSTQFKKVQYDSN